MITIAVDAMGGDNAPDAVVQGCLRALAEHEELKILLAGPQEKLLELLGGPQPRLEILPANDVITNHDHPTMAIRRMTESSLVKALEAVKADQAQGLVCAGSTGAVLAGGIFRVGRIAGIERPALAPLLPTAKGTPVMLIDCGANVDCKPSYLLDFALMGSVYMQNVCGVRNPRVALINIGAEAEKGNALTKEAYGLLEASGLNFIGNIEGRDLMSGEADVLVCDGFSGNLLLKHTEGIAGVLMGMMKEEFLGDTRSKLGAALLKPALRRFKRRMDYTEYGGAPLLGVKKAVIKGHGSSNARAIACAIAQAEKMVRGNVTDVIGCSVASMAAQRSE